ncbi:MAG: hypothetical protein Tsb009_12560 [Planctomycetaceae bacterium]
MRDRQTRRIQFANWCLPGFLTCIVITLVGDACFADGKVQRPRNYSGTLEERGQEAIIIFQAGDENRSAVEDMILKIRVAGSVDNFAWIVPFPKTPTIKKADAKLFRELFNYVEARRIRRYKGEKTGWGKSADKKRLHSGVQVLSREVVGSYDVAVVQETQANSLNQWLEENGYQPLEHANDVLKFYREKKYVFACIKVDRAQLKERKTVDLHPLRFTFKTGGQDGIYFPMKLTGLQSDPFDVNLYVFYRYWLNDSLSKFGYEHRGFSLRYRDWDSPQCEANAGKAYSAPKSDPFLQSYARYFPTLTKLMQASYPGERFYLTNIQARGLKPDAVRNWADDLWMFPYYTNRARVPIDARPGGVASAAWPGQQVDEDGNDPALWYLNPTHPVFIFAVGLMVGILLMGGIWWYRKRKLSSNTDSTQSLAAS